MACVKCNTGILSDEQYYFVADVGHELLFIIHQQLTSEIADDAILCATCFNHALNVFTNSCNSSEINQDTTIQPVGETPVERNECVWCLLTLSGRRTHSLPIGPQRNLISTRIAPRQIPDGGLVCYRCWVQASRLMNASTSTASTQEQSPNICVRCRHSLAVRRVHTIPYGPERDVIAAGIAPKQILPGNKVCYSCWVSARRTVHRANSPEQYNRNGCIVCSTSTVRRQKHLLPNGPVRDVVSRRIYPRQITNHALVCSECWTWAQDTVQHEINDPLQPESDQERPLQVLDMPRHIELNSYRKVGMSSAKCFVPGCTNIERYCVPRYLRKNMLSHYKIHICENARVCKYHKTIYDWDNIINLDDLNNTFNAAEIEKMMCVSIDNEDVHLNFSRMEKIDDNSFKYWTGLTKEQFLTISNEIPLLMQSSKLQKTALGLFLVQARTGDSHERLASLFRMSTAQVTRFLRKAQEALKQEYVHRLLAMIRN